MFLTQAELAELTERKRKGEQIAWLKSNGYHYAIGANGHARVLREHVQAKLCGTIAAAAPAAAEPNWAAM
ncbi:MAG: DUF4224 domain-containing protein [Gallionella sp.]|jgi:hypothetical protein|nr:DUF4224 domain-containing protein [Gallionella sp.]MCK9352785.1 DUF4224 domain-containing protein [Gallionella sp.]